MDVKVKVEAVGPCRKSVRVEITAQTAMDEYTQVVGTFARLVNIPGFRKGRAPKQLVERHYKQPIAEEVRDNIVARTYEEALKQAGLDPVALLDVQGEFKNGEAMNYTILLDVPPEFKLPKYKGISLKSNPAKLAEADVQLRLDALLDGRANYERVTDRPVAAGDLVQIDYEGFLEGRPLSALGKALAGLAKGRDFWCMADANAFLPGFDVGLLGLAVGAETEIQSAFPADFKLGGLAGKTANFRVKVKEIRVKKRPALDADFFKQEGVENEEALRAKLMEDLRAESVLAEKQRMKDELLRTLLSKTTFDLPETVLQEEIQRLYVSTVRENIMRGVGKDQILAQKDELLKSANDSAVLKIKTDYILHRIAEEEKIQLEQADLDRALKELAERYRTTSEEVHKMLEQKKKLDDIRHHLRMEKTLDFLLENASVGEEGFFSRLMGGKRKETEAAPARTLEMADSKQGGL